MGHVSRKSVGHVSSPRRHRPVERVAGRALSNNGPQKRKQPARRTSLPAEKGWLTGFEPATSGTTIQRNEPGRFVESDFQPRTYVDMACQVNLRNSRLFTRILRRLEGFCTRFCTANLSPSLVMPAQRSARKHCERCQWQTVGNPEAYHFARRKSHIG